MSSLVWTMFEGQTGKELRAQLREGVPGTTDSVAVNLSLFTSVKVLVKKTATGTLLVNATPTLDADQTTEVLNAQGVPISGKGFLTFTTEATAAALAVRTSGYLVQFKCMDGLVPHYFPLNRRLEQTFGRLVVHEPLA